MTLDQAQIKQKIVEIVKEQLKDFQHYKLFLFGSRVNGQATDRSDIDIGVEAENKFPSEIILEIKEELEKIRTLNKFDFVDFKAVDQNFKGVALQKIEVLYEK